MSQSVPRSALSAPARPRIDLAPIAPTNGGRISGTRTTALQSPLIGDLYFAASSASGNAISVASVVVEGAILKEFSRPLVSVGSRKIWITYLSVKPRPLAGSLANPPRTVRRIG